MQNFNEEHERALARLTGRDKKPTDPALGRIAAELGITDLTPTQHALRRVANLGVGLGSARDTLTTQTPLEGPEATELLNSMPLKLRSELKITPNITEEGKVVFVMKSGAYVEAALREFPGEMTKPQQGGKGR